MAVPFRFQEGGEPSTIGNPYGGIGKEMGVSYSDCGVQVLSLFCTKGPETAIANP